MPPSIAVVGAGIAGLTTAFLLKQELQQCGRSIPLYLFDAGQKAGGVIHSERIDGFLCEAGPNGFLDNEPTTLQLIEMLDLQSQLISSRKESRFRYIVKNKHLVPLPMGPFAFLNSPLLLPWSKLRLFLEPFLPGKKTSEDESVADFGRRRLGKDVVKWMLDPMVKGIYAGDVENLSFSAAFPKLAQLESEGGSLVRGMLKRRKNLSTKNTIEKTPKKTPQLYSFLQGMGQLVQKLEKHLQEELHLEEPVLSCHLENEQVFLKTSQKTYPCTLVIFATPAYSVAKLFQEQFQAESEILNQIRYAPIVTVCHGYKEDARRKPLHGFGQLHPQSEQLQSLGTLWSSSIFAERAPSGHFLLRTLMGGVFNPDILHQPQKIEAGLAETRQLLDIRKLPCFQSQYTYANAIAQYNVGHLARVKKLEQWQSQVKRIFLTGSAYRGVSVNACIKEAFSLVTQIRNEYLGTLLA